MEAQSPGKLKRVLLVLAEAALVLVIIGLLIAIWLPALVRAHPGALVP